MRGFKPCFFFKKERKKERKSKSSRSLGIFASPFVSIALPQVILTSAGDEFFLPDDHTFFWPQLPEPKFWLTLPNAEHSCVTGLVGLYCVNTKLLIDNREKGNKERV